MQEGLIRRCRDARKLSKKNNNEEEGEGHPHTDLDREDGHVPPKQQMVTDTLARVADREEKKVRASGK